LALAIGLHQLYDDVACRWIYLRYCNLPTTTRWCVDECINFGNCLCAVHRSVKLQSVHHSAAIITELATELISSPFCSESFNKNLYPFGHLGIVAFTLFERKYFAFFGLRKMLPLCTIL